MVPTFETFLYPSLLAYGDGIEKTISDVREFNIKYLQLTSEDCAELIKSGLRTKVQDRTSFSITYLYQAGLIDRTQRAVYTITEEGRTLLNEGIKHISKAYLEEHYPSFYEYSHTRKKVVAISSAKQGVGTSVAEEMTPQEQIDSAFGVISCDLSQQLLDEIKSKSPKFFEHLVVKLLVAMGYGGSLEDAASVTQYSHDEGIDGIIKEDRLGLGKIYIQAKRYDVGPVGRKEIQSFVGALSGKGSKGIFITTSRFTNEAIDYATHSHVSIVLIDGIQLAKLMIEYNVGVSVQQTYEIKRLDQDFFMEE